jgi:hypothetical protein
MATLTGNTPKDTYKGLIKTSDSQEVTGVVKLSDGNGNELPITVGLTSVELTGEVRSNGESVTSYFHDQSVSLDEWHIPHQMNKFPSVVVIDSSNRTVIGDVEYINENELILRFKSAFKGRAYLN